MQRQVWLVTLALSACAHRSAGEREPATLKMPGLLVTPEKVMNDEELFADAGRALEAKAYRDAARKYDLLLRDFPDSALLLPALYNAGLAYEALLEFAAAAARYDQLVSRFPATQDAVDAAFRLGGCYAELARWGESRRIYSDLLAKQRALSLADRIEAFARRGYAELKMGDGAHAEGTFKETLALYRKEQSEERLESKFFVAMAEFHLASIGEERYRAISIRLPEVQMAADMERKAQLLLEVQAQYVRVVRLREPHWAAAAGYQIAGLYRSFYDALIQAPMPPDIAKDEELKTVYLGELRKKLRPLLQKAVRTHEQSLLMVERTGLRRSGVANDWVQRSDAELEALKRLLVPDASPPIPENRPPELQPPQPLPKPPGRKGDFLKPPA